MAVGGFSSYGQIMANRPQHGFGSFRDGMNTGQDMTDFFKRRQLRDELGNSESGVYSDNPEAAAFARTGDFDSARSVMERGMRAQQMENDAEHRNATLGLGYAKLAADEKNALAEQSRKLAEERAKAAEMAARREARMGNIDETIKVIEDNPYSFSSFGNNMFMRGIGLSGDRAARGEVYGRVAQEIQGLQAELAANKVAASTMNSDREGQRALGILADPSSATGSELVAALKIAKKALQGTLTTSMDSDSDPLGIL